MKHLRRQTTTRTLAATSAMPYQLALARVGGLPRKTFFNNRGQGHDVRSIQANLATNLLKALALLYRRSCTAKAVRVFASRSAACVKKAADSAKSSSRAREATVLLSCECRNASGALAYHSEAWREGLKAAGAMFAVLSSPGVAGSRSHSASPRRCLYHDLVSCAPHTRHQYIICIPEQLSVSSMLRVWRICVLEVLLQLCGEEYRLEAGSSSTPR